MRRNHPTRLQKLNIRRRWKLKATDVLIRYGISIGVVRRTIGADTFNSLLDEAYDKASQDPKKGAEIFILSVNTRHIDRLNKALKPVSRE